MRSLQQWKQLKLNLGPVADVLPNRSSEVFIASHLSESPTGQIRLMRGEAALYKIAVRFYIYWKNRKTRVRELLKRGIFRDYAVTTGCARKGPWRMSKVKWVQIALPDAYFTSLGLLFPWI